MRSLFAARRFATARIANVRDDRMWPRHRSRQSAAPTTLRMTTYASDVGAALCRDRRRDAIVVRGTTCSQCRGFTTQRLRDDRVWPRHRSRQSAAPTTLRMTTYASDVGAALCRDRRRDAIVVRGTTCSRHDGFAMRRVRDDRMWPRHRSRQSAAPTTLRMTTYASDVGAALCRDRRRDAIVVRGTTCSQCRGFTTQRLRDDRMWPRHRSRQSAAPTTLRMATYASDVGAALCRDRRRDAIVVRGTTCSQCRGFTTQRLRDDRMWPRHRSRQSAAPTTLRMATYASDVGAALCRDRRRDAIVVRGTTCSQCRGFTTQRREPFATTACGRVIGRGKVPLLQRSA